MKQLLTSLLLGLSVLASAQSDGFQYPFPYNPDGNSDGYISLNDMLDLLSVYGQEYPQSFYSDTTVAVLNLGRMGAHTCQAQAKQAGSEWRIPTMSELPRFSPAAVNTIASGQTASAWFKNDDSNHMMNSWNFSPEPPSSSWDFIYRSDSTEQYRVSHTEAPSSSFNHDITAKRHCFLVSEVRPEFEFSYCNTGSGGDFTTCVTDKLNDGWIPMPGGTKNSASYFYQGFWRIMED